jgi:hypothetical protein
VIVFDIAVRTLAAVAGCLLCYAALFIYEVEEKRIQSTLETWWVLLDDMRKTATGRHAAFLAVAGRMAHLWLGKLFGVRLISVRSIGTSACLSILSFAALTALLPLTRILIDRGVGGQLQRFAEVVQAGAPIADVLSVGHTWKWLVLTVGAVVAIVCSARSHKFAWLPTATALAAIALIALLNPFSPSGPDRFIGGLIVAASLLFGYAADVAAIVFLRITIELQQVPSTPRVLTLLTTQAVLAVLLVAGPAVVAYKWQDILPILVGYPLMLSSGSNFVAAALCLTYAVAAATLILHRLVWPAVERPLYRLARTAVFDSPGRRTVLFAIGAAAITFAAGRSTDLLAAVFKLWSAA